MYMVTLTVRHTGSLEADRATLHAGWRALARVAGAERWWSAYALTYEITPGRDGLGHVHAHAAVVAQWLPYDRIHEVWRAATGSAVINVSAPSRSKKSSAAGAYLAKYVTKGVQLEEFTGQKAGEVLVATYGVRRVTTSRRFWSRDDGPRLCGVCGERHRCMGAPPALRTLQPAGWLRATAELRGVWLARGSPQAQLVW